MVVRKVYLIVLISFISCNNVHETERIADEILNSKPNTIDSIFHRNRPNTGYYLDSVLKGVEPSVYFKDDLKFFTSDYFFEMSYSKMGDKRLNVDDKFCKLIIVPNSEPASKLYFDFNFENELWVLKNIAIRINSDEVLKD